MNVRLVVQVSGTRDGQAWPKPGSVVDLPDAEAKDLLAAGQAVSTDAPYPPETATLPDDGKVQKIEAAYPGAVVHPTVSGIRQDLPKVGDRTPVVQPAAATTGTTAAAAPVK